jgi:thiamine monophosphate kinase
VKITPAILKNLYSAIYCMKPFDRWNMPLPEQIKWVVDKDEQIMGSYLYDDGEKYEHIITISEARCGHLSTIIRVLCHEAIHMSRHKTHRWTHHDKEFRKRAMTISQELGFDPLEL